MKTKTLLIIGDPSKKKRTETSSFSKFKNYTDYLTRKKIDYTFLSYRALLSKKTPVIDSDSMTVLLFFPYIYWNRHVENYEDRRIYGDHTFGKLYRQYFTIVDKQLRQVYKKKKITYINPPASIAIDRDKKTVKEIFSRHGIPTPRIISFKKPTDVTKLLARGNQLYIKPRYGAMGKGISYLERGMWLTNFSQRKGKITSPRYDYRWKIKEFTNNTNFLRQLLRAGSICEQAIVTPRIKRQKFDLRIYVIFGRVPYLYARATYNHKYVTNWSQGGRKRTHSILNGIPPARLKAAKQLAIKTAAALKMNFCGIDIIFSKGFKKAYVLEAQSFPSSERGFDLFKYLINCL